MRFYYQGKSYKFIKVVEDMVWFQHKNHEPESFTKSYTKKHFKKAIEYDRHGIRILTSSDKQG